MSQITSHFFHHLPPPPPPPPSPLSHSVTPSTITIPPQKLGHQYPPLQPPRNENSSRSPQNNESQLIVGVSVIVSAVVNVSSASLVGPGWWQVIIHVDDWKPFRSKFWHFFTFCPHITYLTSVNSVRAMNTVLLYLTLPLHATQANKWITL